jgi:hypothetical protein
MSLSAHHDDPVLETLARELYALFPTCLRCSLPIAQIEESEVLVHRQRLVHRGACAPCTEPAAGAGPLSPS